MQVCTVNVLNIQGGYFLIAVCPSLSFSFGMLSQDGLHKVLCAFTGKVLYALWHVIPMECTFVQVGHIVSNCKFLMCVSVVMALASLRPIAR